MFVWSGTLSSSLIIDYSDVRVPDDAEETIERGPVPIRNKQVANVSVTGTNATHATDLVTLRIFIFRILMFNLPNANRISGYIDVIGTNDLRIRNHSTAVIFA